VPSRSITIEVFEVEFSKRHGYPSWRWLIRAPNGIAIGMCVHNYTRKWNAQRAAETIVRAIRDGMWTMTVPQG
jgi:hypothetical protein